VDLLGADQNYLLKKPISLFIAPEDQSVFYINRSRAFAGDLKDPFEISLRKRDGSTWSARVHAHPVETPNQRLPGMLLAVEDITAYRQALEALQFKEYFANLVFSIMDDLAVWSTADMDEIITYSLEKMGLVTGADRVYVCLFHERKTRLSITHEWLGDDIKSPAQALDGAPLATFSHMVNQLKKRTTVAVADIQHLESAERGAYEAFHAPGVKAFLFSPLFYGRFLLGIIGCDAVQKPMAWTAETKNLVKCMGTAIVNALVRRQVEQTPTDIRQSLLQFVKAESDIVIDEPYEYEGPIEIIDNVTDTATKEAQWQIEAGAPESSEELGTALLKDGKTANIACRNCNRQKLIERSEIRTLGTRLKVTCICGNAMYIKIELRREHRKKVNLEGVFMRGPGDRIALKSDDWGNILITNLSRHGVGFNLFDKQDFRLNDRFRVKFALDNTARSVIQKAVVVRSVAGKAIGCEFAGKDPCDVTLGFYMMT
jgi:PAS domain S-box-containing protein